MANTTTTIRFRALFAGAKSPKRRYIAALHLKQHIARFNKVEEIGVKIDPKLNEYLMSHTITNGDDLKVEISKIGAYVNVMLPGSPAAVKAAAPIGKDAKSAPGVAAPGIPSAKQAPTKQPEQKPASKPSTEKPKPATTPEKPKQQKDSEKKPDAAKK